MGVFIGEASRAAKRALTSNFNGERRAVPLQDLVPGFDDL
jgi:hypothetical protein